MPPPVHTKRRDNKNVFQTVTTYIPAYHTALHTLPWRPSAVNLSISQQYNTKHTQAISEQSFKVCTPGIHLLALRIESGRRLVQKQYGRVLDNGSGNGYTLDSASQATSIGRGWGVGEEKIQTYYGECQGLTASWHAAGGTARGKYIQIVLRQARNKNRQACIDRSRLSYC